jgi:hypothetical protein
VADIVVKPLGNEEFRVEVSEGASRTTHRVTLRRDAQLRYGGGAEPEALLEASFRFLLEREPKESILQAFDLPVIEQYFPEYPREIGERLGR